MLFSSTSDFPLSVSPFLSMADLLLLMLAKYSWIWAHNERILTPNSPNIKIQLVILSQWIQPPDYQTDKELSLFFFSAAVIDSGRRNLFTPPVLYFPPPPSPLFTIVSPALFARRHLHMERTVNTAKSCKNPTAFPIPPGWIRLLCWHPSLQDTISLS